MNCRITFLFETVEVHFMSQVPFAGGRTGDSRIPDYLG